jgi:hypothetical protein
LEHGKGSELLDNQQRASRDDAKRNIFFLMLNAGHPVCRSPIPFNQIVVIGSNVNLCDAVVAILDFRSAEKTETW